MCCFCWWCCCWWYYTTHNKQHHQQQHKYQHQQTTPTPTSMHVNMYRDLFFVLLMLLLEWCCWCVVFLVVLFVVGGIPLALRLELVPVFHVGMPLLLRPTTSLCDAWYVNGSGMLLCESELTWQELVDFMGSIMASQYVDCHQDHYSCTWVEHRGWHERHVWKVQYVWGHFRPGPIFSPGPIQAGADLPIFQAATGSGHHCSSQTY